MKWQAVLVCLCAVFPATGATGTTGTIGAQQISFEPHAVFGGLEDPASGGPFVEAALLSDGRLLASAPEIGAQILVYDPDDRFRAPSGEREKDRASSEARCESGPCPGIPSWFSTPVWDG